MIITGSNAPDRYCPRSVAMGGPGRLPRADSTPHAVAHSCAGMLRARPRLGFIEPCLSSPADRPPAGSGWIRDQGLGAVMSAALALLCATIAPGHAQDDADRYWRTIQGGGKPRRLGMCRCSGFGGKTRT